LAYYLAELDISAITITEERRVRGARMRTSTLSVVGDGSIRSNAEPTPT
jgi:hypothetical protein